MRTKIYVPYRRQSKLNQLIDYIEIKLSRLNCKVLNFVKVAQKNGKEIHIWDY